jgi:proteasome component ECM29
MIEIQETFINLLADPKSTQFSRESCCIGLGACRSILAQHQDNVLTEDAMTARLLKAFGQTSNFGVSAYMETGDQAAERRGETATVGEGQRDREAGVGSVAGMNEASLRAYREAASACVELGRQDLLYALLFLSVSHSYWLVPENRYKYGYEKGNALHRKSANVLLVLQVRSAHGQWQSPRNNP